MLEIKTIRNTLITDEKKDGFCFRSGCNQTLTESELVSEMAGYNASFTEADYKGMLAVLKEVSVKYLAKGYNVEYPFGTLRPSATGTCSKVSDSFTLNSGNNKLSFLFAIAPQAQEEILRNLEYKQVAPDLSGTAKIYRICTLNADASENDALDVSPMSVLRIVGRNLSFDFSDEKQGVFLEGENEKLRISQFHRAGSNIVDAIIPKEAAAGDYNAKIVTKPGNSYFTDVSTERLSVNAAIAD